MPPWLIRLMDWKIFRGRAGYEDRLAMEVATFLRGATLDGHLIATWTHIPHEVGGGNKRASQVRYALAKAMGLITGSCDYVFVWEGGGGWIELKAKKGSMSPAQRDFREWCAATGCYHVVCRDLDEVIDKLFAWGALQGRPRRAIGVDC